MPQIWLPPLSRNGIYMRVILMNGHSHPAAFMWAYFFFSHGFLSGRASLSLTSLSSNFNINSSASRGPRAPAVASEPKTIRILKHGHQCLYLFSWRELIQEQGCFPLSFVSACICFLTLWSLQKACSEALTRSLTYTWSSIHVGHFALSHLSLLSVLSCQYSHSTPSDGIWSPKGSSPL